MKLIRGAIGGLIVALAVNAFAADFAWSAASSQAGRSVKGIGATSDTFGEGATDGMNLTKVGGFAVWVCADEGETIKTAVELTAYAYHSYVAAWAPAPVWNLAGSQTGVQCEYLDAFPVYSPVGRVGYAPSAGAVSSGDLTIWILATSAAGDSI